MNKSYSVRKARYAKGKMVVSQIETDGWKSRFGRLVEALGGKWVHRDHGYQLSPTKLAKFEKMFADGWDAGYFGGLIQPKS